MCHPPSPSRAPGHRPGFVRAVVCALLLAVEVSAVRAEGFDERRAGDVLSLALPAGVLAAEAVRGDAEGLRGFAGSFATTLVLADVLQRTTGVERPDHGNDRSFPSGHAARAFAAAAYVHRRHGLEAAVPLYALATWVGHTRVHSQRLRWADVAGAAALSLVVAWAMVRSRGDRPDTPAVAVRWSVTLP